jgi:hypothetical protein
MPITSEGEFLKGRGLRLDRFSVMLLGRIADKGIYKEAGLFNELLGEEELRRRRSALRDLIQRKIVKRDKKGGLAIGEFGESHCKWIWGKDFEPAKVKEPKRRPAAKTQATMPKAAKTTTVRPQGAKEAATRVQAPKKPTLRLRVPNAAQRLPQPRSQAMQHKIDRAITRTRRP